MIQIDLSKWLDKKDTSDFDEVLLDALLESAEIKLKKSPEDFPSVNLSKTEIQKFELEAVARVKGTRYKVSDCDPIADLVPGFKKHWFKQQTSVSTDITLRGVTHSFPANIPLKSEKLINQPAIIPQSIKNMHNDWYFINESG